jgi:multifunctional 2-oxoglutarate metabolism enzyme
VSDTSINTSAFIAENFGANATYVEGLLARFQADPNSVDETWREFFTDMLNGGNGLAVQAQQTAPAPQVETRPSGSVPAPMSQPVSQAPKTPAAPSPALSPDTEAKPLTGPAKKIVENMEQSLTVPTATSIRSMPVKLLEENRRIINEHLGPRGRGKASFTHLIGWAIVQAAKTYPAMNNGFAVIDGAPSRLTHESINLGIAIDIEKKDGTRNLLVPNIKGWPSTTPSNERGMANSRSPISRGRPSRSPTPAPSARSHPTRV